MKEPPPWGSWGFRYYVWGLVTSSGFHCFNILVIICNTLVLCLDHAGQPPWLARLEDQLSLIFTVIFIIEMVLKMIGLLCGGGAGRRLRQPRRLPRAVCGEGVQAPGPLVGHCLGGRVSNFGGGVNGARHQFGGGGKGLN